MTTIAHSGRAWGFTTGLGAHGAGETGEKIRRLFVEALGSIKVERSALSAAPFYDLGLLAEEERKAGNDVRSALDRAQMFLLALPDGIPAPEISTDPEGDILFDWSGPHGELLTVALNSGGRLAYAARLSASDKEHGVKTFVDSIPQVVQNLIRQIARG